MPVIITGGASGTINRHVLVQVHIEAYKGTYTYFTFISTSLQLHSIHACMHDFHCIIQLHTTTSI